MIKKLPTNKIISGKIVNLASGKDTAKVEVERKLRHPKYEKLIKLHKTYLVHLPEDQKQKYELGVEVKILQTKPFSARKSWMVIINK